MIETTRIHLSTQGNGEVLDITEALNDALQKGGVGRGLLTVFCPSATSAVTTIEFESGAVRDFRRLFDQIVPEDQPYLHNRRWGDGNGHSHVRAALLGPSLTIPFAEKKLLLGTWQQVVHVEFDNQPRDRSLVVQIMGER